ncbi:hypothetical protein QBC39DRAFT_55788 [Podospora conica]|nr:hypothetical protein QBC39DRAFT_55788 [Schizothecium conicum]
MATDKDADLAGSSHQSKRPPLDRFDSSSEQIQTSQQQPRPRAQKHVVGGGRVHARVPSSKALHKHHATASTAKLNRRRSNSPDHQANPPTLASTHRRAPSDPRIDDESGPSNLKKNTSQTSLKRNRSHVDVGKKTKSALNLKRSSSNPAVHKLKGGAASKVHFNLGDDDDEPEAFIQDDNPDDEWVDASASASPLLSRRSSVAASGQTAETTDDHRTSPRLSHELGPHQTSRSYDARGLSQSPHLDPASLKQQYLTSRILQRAPSQGAPPMMSTESVSVRPNSSTPNSPDLGGNGKATLRSETPKELRPGSSGNVQELTSRFVGHNSQEPGSEIPIDSFLHAINNGGISRAAASGKQLDKSGLRRPLSTGNIAQPPFLRRRHGIDRPGQDDDDGSQTGEDDDDAPVSHPRRSGGYVVPMDMNRTQQKLNLQRASSSLETAPYHPSLTSGIHGGLIAAPGTGRSIGGSSNYDPRDPRINKTLERTGMEYLVVRRHQNPILRSLERLAKLPGANKTRPIPRAGTRPSTAHSQRRPDTSGGGRSRPVSLVEREPSSVATLIGGQGQSARRPGTPRSAFSSRHLHTGSNSTIADVDDDVARMHERQRLSGSSLVNGEEDAATIALLRQMWDRNLELSTSQD